MKVSKSFLKQLIKEEVARRKTPSLEDLNELIRYINESLKDLGPQVSRFVNESKSRGSKADMLADLELLSEVLGRLRALVDTSGGK